ncbi:hypothetical protein CAPTEDRAFT_200382 [Capitella teleta]|uniref:Uncharacterized protein n=1 Tax=Capitella teleta TaxID=283909 RepID=R7USN0_CAPTE|nr:hypothetical protein CAPTEDRAFT_200382 [Capitella teleta]|eukprot:ELU09509.1 hypothetical protein CAPTEDRAFT_200382 [Capitella teleta]
MEGSFEEAKARFRVFDKLCEVILDPHDEDFEHFLQLRHIVMLRMKRIQDWRSRFPTRRPTSNATREDEKGIPSPNADLFLEFVRLMIVCFTIRLYPYGGTHTNGDHTYVCISLPKSNIGKDIFMLISCFDYAKGVKSSNRDDKAIYMIEKVTGEAGEYEDEWMKRSGVSPSLASMSISA